MLSLDAPLVSIAWMWMLAHALRVEYIQASVWWVLPLGIWCVYVVDRLIDAWRHPAMRESSPRHFFHWRWRWVLSVSVAIVAFICVYHALYVLPRSLFSAGVVVAMLCVFYFALALFSGRGIPYVKNFLAAIIFAMGVGIPVNVANSSLLITDLNEVLYAMRNTGLVDALWNLCDMIVKTLILVFLYCREVWVFGLLCMMNITAIDLWEKADAESDEALAYSHEATLTLGLVMLAGGALLFAAMRADEYSKPYFYAVMVAAALLQVINHYRERFSMNALRILADVALLVPLPIFFVAIG
ncbi:MAG: hypothetical protein P8O22_05975 [Akkermansiaceae bacterium]|nr:hypothetical protein [Akkermansiaceae bacterium]